MDVASEETVLGDFNDAEFTLHGITSRFYKKDGKFFVHTNGPGGEMGDFEITHTFGWFPLQQYLIPFPGGRLQTLHIAWDSRDNKWFRVPPEGPVDPDDWLYWTNAAQNWNGMCAQCHSTNLQKNYDPVTDSTTPPGQISTWVARPAMALAPLMLIGRKCRKWPGRKQQILSWLFRLQTSTRGNWSNCVHPVIHAVARWGMINTPETDLLDNYPAQPAERRPVFFGRPDPGRGLRVRLLHTEQNVPP